MYYLVCVFFHLRYDLDGVHIDDYFYPWPVGTEHFPDNGTYDKYISDGGDMPLDEWRRDNVNNLVKSFYHTAKSRRESIVVSISPAGLYRPGHPEGMQPPITGSDQYELVHADPKKWLLEGWTDVLIPQIYWNIESSGQPFVPILEWWLGANPQGKWIIPGSALYKIREDYEGWDPTEITDQVDETRKLQFDGAEGNNLYSAQYLRDDLKGCKQLFKAYYSDKCTMPTIPKYIPDS